LGAVPFAVGRSDHWIAAEAKIRLPRIVERPTAALRAERINRHGGGGETRVSKGGCLGARQDGLCRRRLGGRLRFGVAVGPGDRAGGGGGGDGGQLDIGGPNLPCHHESDGHHNTGRGFASAVLPPPDISFAGVEPPGGGALLDFEGVERPGKFGHGRGAWASLPETKHAVKFCRG
jgi:hypothetical protein